MIRLRPAFSTASVWWRVNGIFIARILRQHKISPIPDTSRKLIVKYFLCLYQKYCIYSQYTCFKNYFTKLGRLFLKYWIYSHLYYCLAQRVLLRFMYSFAGIKTLKLVNSNLHVFKGIQHKWPICFWGIDVLRGISQNWSMFHFRFALILTAYLQWGCLYIYPFMYYIWMQQYCIHGCPRFMGYNRYSCVHMSLIEFRLKPRYF